ncbi:hypothetical protein, partial [Rossellomorea marisflavi]|uniref:hypothetical protein n=1 Tax=Rossellomorea marisflavi TaxID=189381 RepID=UPI00064EC343
MFTVETLKNIHISDFKEFFREKKVKGRTVRIKDDSTVGKYSKILALITEELEDSDGSFKESDISSFLFEKLFYDNN